MTIVVFFLFVIFAWKLRPDFLYDFNQSVFHRIDFLVVSGSYSYEKYLDWMCEPKIDCSFRETEMKSSVEFPSSSNSKDMQNNLWNEINNIMGRVNEKELVSLF